MSIAAAQARAEDRNLAVTAPTRAAEHALDVASYAGEPGNHEPNSYQVERANWGLHRYVEQIAIGLGVGMESANCAAEAPANAYLALTQRLPTAPEHDVALAWNTTYGWWFGLETAADEEIRAISYLGESQLLAEPENVVFFAKALLAGHHAGQPEPRAIPRSQDPITELGKYAT